MPVSLNTTLRNNRADEISTFAGASAKLRLYTAAYAAQLVECVCAATLTAALDGVAVHVAAANDAEPEGAAVLPLVRRSRRPRTARLAVQLDGVAALIDATLQGRTRAARDEEWRQLRRAA